jgi:hypothetical protein
VPIGGSHESLVNAPNLEIRFLEVLRQAELRSGFHECDRALDG